MNRRKNLFELMGTVILLVALSVPIMQCAPAAEEAGTYENYVASLPEGCFPVPRDCYEQAIEEGELYIYNWADWWPEEIYTDFENEFGIKVTFDPLSSTDEQVAKFKLTSDVEYDLTAVGPKGYLRLKEIDVLAKANPDWLPNVNEYLPEPIKEIRFSSENPYTVPIDTFFNDYIYNKKYVAENDPRIGSYALLFENEEHAGRITWIDDMFDVIGAALLYLDYSFNSVDEAELTEAKELLLRQKPFLMAWDSLPKKSLVSGEAWISMGYSGDMRMLNLDDPETFEVVMPQEGALYGMDKIVFPIGGKHRAAAHLFTNYFHRPQVYMTFMGDFPAGCVNLAAAELLPEEWKSFLDINPTEEYLAKCEVATRQCFTGKGLELRTAVWEELKG